MGIRQHNPCRALTELSLPQKLIKLKKTGVEDSRSYVSLGISTLETFYINNGLKQSPSCNLFLHHRIRKSSKGSEDKYANVLHRLSTPSTLAYDIDIAGKNTISVKKQFSRHEQEQWRIYQQAK